MFALIKSRWLVLKFKKFGLKDLWSISYEHYFIKKIKLKIVKFILFKSFSLQSAYNNNWIKHWNVEIAINSIALFTFQALIWANFHIKNDQKNKLSNSACNWFYNQKPIINNFLKYFAKDSRAVQNVLKFVKNWKLECVKTVWEVFWNDFSTIFNSKKVCIVLVADIWNIYIAKSVILLLAFFLI